MHRKKYFWDRLGGYLDIPAEVLPGGFGLSMSGQQALTVHGCRRILDYSDRQIVLLLGGTRQVTVEGEALLCTVFRAGSVTVEGRIEGLRFGGNKDEAD